MNLAFTLAVGDKRYGNFALNWALSVKHTFPKAKLALIYEPQTIEGLEDYLGQFFDYTYAVSVTNETNPNARAYKLKTELYDIATKIAPEAEAYLYMDADTLMLSGRSVDEYFEELKGVPFTAWCNDVYDFKTKTRQRDDYTFWCDVENIPSDKGKMPQLNSSFLYFQKGIAKEIFDGAKAFNEPECAVEHKIYKGTKPDEFCFNISCFNENVLPHQIPYYPIFFTFQSENFEEQYIRQWKAIGFAGEKKQHDSVVHLYNHNVKYYRDFFNVDEPYHVGELVNKTPIDKDAFQIKPIAKKTIFRRDEVINSGGGIFNPDGVANFVLFRKEANHDFYKSGHNQATAIPHIAFGDYSAELSFTNKPDGLRFEDFRLVENGCGEIDGSFLCSHTVIENNLTPQMTASVGLSKIYITEAKFEFQQIVKLPIKTGRIEKNWVFFIEGLDLYCVYSVSPYTLFKFDGKEWTQCGVFPLELDWIHKEQKICNSTKPTLIGNEYLMLFHTKERGIFFQGALLIDKDTKEITHYTKHSIPIKEWGEGFQKNLIYVSGACYLKDKNVLRVFFGEADSHSCHNDYNADEFLAIVRQNSVEDNNNKKALERLKQIL